MAEIWLQHWRPFTLLHYCGNGKHQVLRQGPKVHSDFFYYAPPPQFFLSFLPFSFSSSSSHLLVLLPVLPLLLTKIWVNYLAKLLNLCQDVTNISMCWGILVNKNFTSVE